jgi:hypothetical protein
MDGMEGGKGPHSWRTIAVDGKERRGTFPNEEV